MYTIFSAVQRPQRKSDVMTSFGTTIRSLYDYNPIDNPIHAVKAVYGRLSSECQHDYDLVNTDDIQVNMDHL
jgi:hypothetical protein